MNNNLQTEPPVENNTEGRKFGCLQVIGILLIGMIIAAVITFLVLKKYIFPSEFSPVVLNSIEEQVLDKKLAKLDVLESGSSQTQNEQDEDTDRGQALTPEAYSEEGASREVEFSEKELNAMLAKNTDLARKLAIDLSDNLVSAKLLVPVDEDFPIFAGKTIKVRAGLELAYQNGRPVVVLKGLSIMGVPIPNAWLGGLKNIDLVKEYGSDTNTGFWKSFSEGVEFLQVEEGQLKLKLKE